MKRALRAALVIAAVLAAVVPVATVTNGQPDGANHPYVGVAIQEIPSMPGFVSVCSGSALSSTAFLTAAHCFDPSLPVFVSFKSGPPFGATFTPGVVTNHPLWCFECDHSAAGTDTHDVAVVSLLAPATAGPFALLPSVGLADTLPTKTDVDLVGYGVQGFIRGGGKPGQVFLFTRYFAPSQLVQSNDVLSPQFLKLTANPSKGKGGVCFGDSGGPDLLAGTDTILAVNSLVTNTNCAGVTYSQRVDLPDILEFIQGFLN